MKQHHAVIVLFALILASSLTGFGSYRTTSRQVDEDMCRALALTLQEQQSDVISPDTIRMFNSHLQIASLRGKATLAVDVRSRGFKPYPHCSKATIFSLSDQRPAAIMWLLTGFWALFVWHRSRQHDAGQQRLVPISVAATTPSPSVSGESYGGLVYSSSTDVFYAANGEMVQLTPMQHKLMTLFFQSPTHSLTKTEICDVLWPKKPDASDTLYTLIRRLKHVVEQQSQLKIECDRSKAYRLTVRPMED